MNDTQITLERVNRKLLTVVVKGTAPLICHRWNEKAKQQMLDAMQGRKKIKTQKDPEAEYKASLYTLGDGYGFPVTAFKAATIGGARYFKSVAMTQLRRSLFFAGEGPDQLVRIDGTPIQREDMVRVGMGTDLRYRGMFPDWSAKLQITYVADLLDVDSVVSLVEAGGMGGIGEWRPEKSATGTFGTYEVVGTFGIGLAEVLASAQGVIA